MLVTVEPEPPELRQPNVAAAFKERDRFESTGGAKQHDDVQMRVPTVHTVRHFGRGDVPDNRQRPPGTALVHPALRELQSVENRPEVVAGAVPNGERQEHGHKATLTSPGE